MIITEHGPDRSPELILLNGAPGLGKSTLARRYLDDHRLALDLDIDQIRALLGGWADEPTTAGVLARDLALAAARTHLRAGYDVIVPQLVARPEFIDRLAALARDCDLVFRHVLLVDDKDRARDRFAQRTTRAENPHHLAAADQLARGGGAAQLDAYHDALTTLAAERSEMIIVRSHIDQVERTYQEFLVALGR